jgi:hypothetical protein
VLEQIDRLAVLTPPAGHQAVGVLKELGPVHRDAPQREARAPGEMALASSRQ